MRQVAIVVPCFNEAERLPVERFRAFLAEDKSVGLVLVDDGSRDATRAVLEEVARGFEDRARVLALPRNAGKAEAVRQGILRALEDEPDVVGFWDADLATPLDAVSRLCSVFDERPRAEMVFGARVALLGRRIRRKAWRHYLGRLFATAVSQSLGLAIYDTQCGAKVFRVTPQLPELFAEPFVTRWLFDVEIVARFLVQRRGRGPDAPAPHEAIVEYPLEEWVDVSGSKVGIRDFVGALLGLLRIRRRYRIASHAAGRTPSAAR